MGRRDRPSRLALALGLCATRVSRTGAGTVVWETFTTADCTGPSADVTQHLGECARNTSFGSKMNTFDMSTRTTCGGGAAGGMSQQYWPDANCSGKPLSNSDLNEFIIDSITATLLGYGGLTSMEDTMAEGGASPAAKAELVMRVTSMTSKIQSRAFIPTNLSPGDCLKTMDLTMPNMPNMPMAFDQKQSVKLRALPVSCGGDEVEATAAVEHSIEENKLLCLDTSVFDTACPRPSYVGNGFTPDTCPSACAHAFLGYFDQCEPYLANKIPDHVLASLQAFKTKCVAGGNVCKDAVGSGLAGQPCGPSMKQYCDNPMFAKTLLTNCPVTCGKCGSAAGTVGSPTVTTAAPTPAPTDGVQQLTLSRYSSSANCSPDIECVPLLFGQSLSGVMDSAGNPAQCTSQTVDVSLSTFENCQKSLHGAGDWFRMSCGSQGKIILSDYVDEGCTIPQLVPLATAHNGEAISIALSGLPISINTCTNITALYVMKLVALKAKPGADVVAINGVIDGFRYLAMSSWEVNDEGNDVCGENEQ